MSTLLGGEGEMVVRPVWGPHLLWLYIRSLEAGGTLQQALSSMPSTGEVSCRVLSESHLGRFIFKSNSPMITCYNP
jgi:hypothetical protein